ncbi:hypothetical protein GOFOIKOB_4498 [Methylobacterium tardum]|uniref:Heme utilization protein n=1 Tax=Methylobacterium tardum TaxID=374432 RepID=A0AA37TQ68_9HYPH|nr:heme utilization protein [Methylobacterium tardum]URD39475.1 heme utilization protein [Methylobacterium tardum]GJE51439.1 hypothetical protein GOFOIKOB_4498 [Methylobacterium tardum]GLS73666.1 hypothetical protein GCM10007890_56810 [Methylobacterium tardum]
MARTPAAVLAAALSISALCPASAATKKVHVPDQYDGSWSITAVTTEGPCSPSTTYHVQIKDNDTSIPGEDIDIDGSVTSSGVVTATITKGSVKVPITGSLDPKGTGRGTWQTKGGLVACTGSWSATRSRSDT